MLLKVFTQTCFKLNKIQISEIPSITNDENVTIAPGQGKKPVSILNDEFFEEHAFPYLLPKGKFRYKAPRDIPVSLVLFFNQRLLNFNQYFASDADYILFVRYLYKQHHLRSSIKFAMHKIKPGTFKGTVKGNFNETIERSVARNNTFSFMSSV